MTMPVFFTGDTGPDLTATIREEADPTRIADLTEATVNCQIRRADDRRYTVNQPAAVVGAGTDGKVSYSWAPNDLSVPGIYQVQWEITFLGGKIQTTLPQPIEVRRQ